MKWKRPYTVPNSVYDALPYFYVACGLLTMVVLRNPMAVFSGLVLLSAGATVWALRYRYRRELERVRGMKNLGDVTGKAQRQDGLADTDGLLQVSWRAHYESGHPVMDAQHRRLFGISNELIHALRSELPKSAIEDLATELLSHLAEHLTAEEELLDSIHHPHADVHRQLHHVLRNRASQVHDRYQQGSIDAREFVSNLTMDVVFDHLLNEDLKYSFATGADAGRSPAG